MSSSVFHSHFSGSEFWSMGEVEPTRFRFRFRFPFGLIFPTKNATQNVIFIWTVSCFDCSHRESADSQKDYVCTYIYTIIKQAQLSLSGKQKNGGRKEMPRCPGNFPTNSHTVFPGPGNVFGYCCTVYWLFSWETQCSRGISISCTESVINWRSLSIMYLQDLLFGNNKAKTELARYSLPVNFKIIYGSAFL